MTMYTQEAQELSAKLDRIEQKLDRLLMLMGHAPQAVPGASPYTAAPQDPLYDHRFEEVRNFIRQGQKINAIKAHRELTNLGLKESKDFVEDLEVKMRHAGMSAW